MRRRPSTFCLQALLAEQDQVTINRMVAIIQLRLRGLEPPHGCIPSWEQTYKYAFNPQGKEYPNAVLLYVPIFSAQE